MNFHHTTCESKCDTLPSSAANHGDNTVSVAQSGTATPGATKQLFPPDRVFKRNIYIYIYIYITVATHRQICFVLSELISVGLAVSSRSGDRNPVDSYAKPKLLTIQLRDISCEVNFKRLWITITIVYIHPFKRLPIPQFIYEEVCHKR